MTPPQNLSIERADDTHVADATAIVGEYMRAIGEETGNGRAIEEVSEHLGAADAALFLARTEGGVAACIAVHRFDAVSFETKVDTKATMLAAIALYERCGYRPIPRYHDRDTAQLFFAKELA